jgi:hypothetical protein
MLDDPVLAYSTQLPQSGSWVAGKNVHGSGQDHLRTR